MFLMPGSRSFFPKHLASYGIKFNRDRLVSANLTVLTNTLLSNVTLNSTTTYFDGPSISQGPIGTWFASGTVTVTDSAAVANFSAKLWDGVTIMDSALVTLPAIGFVDVISLSGFITNPAGNIKISVKDGSATTGTIQFNASGNSKDSTITAVRIV